MHPLSLTRCLSHEKHLINTEGRKEGGREGEREEGRKEGGREKKEEKDMEKKEEKDMKLCLKNLEKISQRL